MLWFLEILFLKFLPTQKESVLKKSLNLDFHLRKRAWNLDILKTKIDIQVK